MPKIICPQFDGNTQRSADRKTLSNGSHAQDSEAGRQADACGFRCVTVWEYASDEAGEDDERDQTWVRPVGCGGVRRDEYSQLVAADFTTQSGKVLRGFMIVTTASNPVEITPGAVVARGLYAVLPAVSRDEAKKQKWNWSLDARAGLVRRLQIHEKDLYLLRYQLATLIAGEKVRRAGVVYQDQWAQSPSRATPWTRLEIWEARFQSTLAAASLTGSVSARHEDPRSSS